MLTLAQIQTDVQFLADESTLVLSSTANLPVINGFYREFCASRLFPELEYTDTSITTIAGQEGYTWPANVQFLTEPALILQRTTGNPRNFVKVWPVQDNIYWGFLKNVVQSFPSHYKKEKANVVTVTTATGGLTTTTGVTSGIGGYILLMRPVSNITGLQLLIIGQVAPKEFVQASDPTTFGEVNTDHAFAHFIAAKFQMKRGNAARAQELLDDADDLLPEGNYGPTARPNNNVPWLT